MPDKYIVVCQQVIKSPNSSKWEIDYNWDGEKFDTLNEAKSHGFKIRESDDFNIARIKGKKVVAFYWMDKEFEKGDYDLNAISRAISL